MSFIEILNDLLLENGKTKIDLSKEADIPYTTICGWLKAGRLPDYNAIKKLAKYFKVTTDYLLDTENEEETIAQIKTYTDDEQALLQAYRKMSPGKKKALFQMLDITIDEVSKKIKRN